MTPAAFRKMALALEGVIEASHMGHPDFRVAGRIFATLGAPDETCGMVRLEPEQQRVFLTSEPDIFFPARGQWGKSGCTHVRLKPARVALVRPAMNLAHAMAQELAANAKRRLDGPKACPDNDGKTGDRSRKNRKRTR